MTVQTVPQHALDTLTTGLGKSFVDMYKGSDERNDGIVGVRQISVPQGPECFHSLNQGAEGQFERVTVFDEGLHERVTDGFRRQGPIALGPGRGTDDFDEPFEDRRNLGSCDF